MNNEVIKEMELINKKSISSDNILNIIKKLKFSSYGVYIALFVIVIFNMFYTKNFLSINTFWNLIVYSTTIIFVAMGMNLVISTGGIDISVGSTMALAGTTLALFIGKIGLIPAFILAIFISFIPGFIIGTIIEKFNIQPIITTLAMMIAVRGFAQIISKGAIITFNQPILENIAYYRIGGTIPIQAIYIFIVVGFFYIFVNKTIWGRYIEALGDNKEASIIMGVNVKRIIKFVYIIMSFIAGMAGILEASRLSSANPNSLGQLMELDAIAAVAIGGTMMSGGKPKIINTVIGVFIMQLITMTINMNNIQYSYSLIFKAIIIILAVYIQRERK